MDDEPIQSALWPALGAGVITLAATLGGYLAFDDSSSAETVAAANAATSRTSTTPSTSPPVPSTETREAPGSPEQSASPPTEPSPEDPAPAGSSPMSEPPPSSTAPPPSDQSESADPPSDGFASSEAVEWGGFSPGSPEAVVGAFYDAVREDDCQQIVDLWSQSHTDMLGGTRQEQLQTCNQMMDPAMAPPPLEPSDVQSVSDDGAVAVVSVTIEINGTPSTEEIHLVMESGWKIDLLGTT